jgi:hypothetical protein
MFHKIRSTKIETGDLLKHETKSHILIKFSLVLLILLAYFTFISIKYGVQEGFLVSALSWSFFVLCTPIADAGFLIDFPLRLVTNLKMILAEVLVWLIAIGLNLYALFLKPEIYQKTKLLELFKHILEKPFPLWGVILISLAGTFLSIKFGDELMDKVQHKERKFHQKHKFNHQLIVMIFFVALSLVLYHFLLQTLDINLPA